MWRPVYAWRTSAGSFYILDDGGRYRVFYGEEELGSYPTPEQAAEDLAAGRTVAPSDGVDTAALGIPSDLTDWDMGPAAAEWFEHRRRREG